VCLGGVLLQASWWAARCRVCQLISPCTSCCDCLKRVVAIWSPSHALEWAGESAVAMYIIVPPEV